MSKLKDYDLYFIHIPKNAGTAFNLQMGIQNNGHYKITDFNRVIWPKTIVIIRNPFTRLISFYNYAKLEKSYWHSNDKTTQYEKHILHDYCDKYSFEQFIVDLCINNRFDNDMRFLHLLPQNYWILTPENKIVSNILRFEYLDEDISKLLNKKIELKKINDSKTKDYTGYYNDKTRELVYKKYKRDFELFGPFEEI